MPFPASVVLISWKRQVALEFRAGTSDVLLFDLDLAGDDLRIVLVCPGAISLVKCTVALDVAAFRCFTAIWRL